VTRFLLIESCDFRDFPSGGQLSFARQMMAAFPGDLALVGIRTGAGPVGEWTSERFDDREMPFFAVARKTRTAMRPLVPARLSTYLALRSHRAGILEAGAAGAFIQSPEVALAVRDWNLPRFCYRFAGAENPLLGSRYGWARFLARPFEERLFAALRRAERILVTADRDSTERMLDRSRGAIDRKKVVFFPTRVDPAVFRPSDQSAARARLGLAGAPLLIQVGRINWIKGWDLLLDAFATLRETMPEARLILVGDGEDRSKVMARALRLGVGGAVAVTGFLPPEEVAAHLAAADLAVLASIREGWPTAIVEALACGKPVVCTEVSGARELVEDGVNGVVVETRTPGALARGIARALGLPDAREVSIEKASRYSLVNLRADLLAAWPILGVADDDAGTPREHAS
jgi:glycosyltransferase involved in cell wall biosynthesis